MLSYFVCWYTIVLMARPPAKIIKKIFGVLCGDEILRREREVGEGENIGWQVGWSGESAYLCG